MSFDFVSPLLITIALDIQSLIVISLFLKNQKFHLQKNDLNQLSFMEKIKACSA